MIRLAALVEHCSQVESPASPGDKSLPDRGCIHMIEDIQNLNQVFGLCRLDLASLERGFKESTTASPERTYCQSAEAWVDSMSMH